MNSNWSKKDLISLCFLKNFKSSQFIKIVNKFSSFEHFIDSEAYKQLFFNNLKDSVKAIIQQSEHQLEVAETIDSKIISIWDSDYPELLKKTSSPPILLFVRGKLRNDLSAIAIVGTRKSTSYGKLSAERFAEFFSVNDIIVVSGLAYGIDTYSHLASVKSGGITYAILPSSLDTISPSTSQKNAEKIIENGGALISEYRFGTVANLASFPQRNRIIAGISIATIVVECGIKSGALITAKIADSESREVFAVPGNITSQRSLGTNKLIRDNLAIIALSPESVLDDLGLTGFIRERPFDSHKITFDDNSEEKLFNILNYEPIHIDTLTDTSGMEYSEVSGKLLMMEFKGIIKQLPGKYYIRTHL